MTEDKKPQLGAVGTRAKEQYAEWLRNYLRINGRDMTSDPAVQFMLPLIAGAQALLESHHRDLGNLAQAIRLLTELLVRSTGDENVEWFAAGGDIARSGPHASQIDAWEAMRYSRNAAANSGFEHPRDTRVWPERKR